MKIYVKRMFNSAAETYDSSADIQRVVADRLLRGIEGLDSECILEIGVGSGLFTDIFINKYDVKKYIGFDIAHNMAKMCSEKFEKKYQFLSADAECLPFKSKAFSGITSSSVFQWLSNPEKSIPKILSTLKPGGTFHFSIFVQGTFQEMDFVNKMTGFGNVYPLRDKSSYINILSEYASVLHTETVEHVLYFDSVKEFLKKQKNTGAKYTGSSKFTGKDAYRKFNELYESYFAEEGRIPVTYAILYVHGRMP